MKLANKKPASGSHQRFFNPLSPQAIDEVLAWDRRRAEAAKQKSIITIDTTKVKSTEYITGITVIDEAELLEPELWPELKEPTPAQPLATVAAIEEFTDYIKLKELSEYTIENNYLPFLRRSLKAYSLVPTDPKLIRRILANYTNRNTRRTYWLYLSTFYSFLEQEHGTPNPMPKVPKPKESKTLPDHLNPEQKELLVKVELSPRDRAILDILIATGLRPSDIANINGRPLRFCDIYEGHIEVSGKGSKGRSVPIPPELRVELLALQNGRRANLAVFVNEWGRPLTTWGLRKVVRRAFIAAGITGVKLTPYTIRHSFGGDFLARGGNLASLQRILGHASVKTTMRYTHLSDKAVADDYHSHMPRASNCLL